MKKTLTVNLGGTVFHIDEDAYRLLDNYLNNLKSYFQRQEGAEEIVNDIEIRICELFLEKIRNGQQVITIGDVEEVIARVGKPEDFADAADEASEEKSESKSNKAYESASGGATYMKVKRRLFRNIDNKLIGGVCSGIAAYFDFSVAAVRIVALILLLFGPVTFILSSVGCSVFFIYIVCWIVIPPARTAADKLAMHGEEINIENIGKTVTDGFEKASKKVNDYVKSDKPRSFFERLGEVLGTIIKVLAKAILILIAIVLSPVVFVLAIIFVVMLVVGISFLVGGGTALMGLPWNDFISFGPFIPALAVVATIASIAVLALPMACIV